MTRNSKKQRLSFPVSIPIVGELGPAFKKASGARLTRRGRSRTPQPQESDMWLLRLLRWWLRLKRETTSTVQGESERACALFLASVKVQFSKATWVRLLAKDSWKDGGLKKQLCFPMLYKSVIFCTQWSKNILEFALPTTSKSRHHHGGKWRWPQQHHGRHGGWRNQSQWPKKETQKQVCLFYIIFNDSWKNPRKNKKEAFCVIVIAYSPISKYDL